MRLMNDPLNDDNHFIAMEYYGGIFNRTFLVILMDEYLIGLKVNNTITTEHDWDFLFMKYITSIPRNADLENPTTYMSKKYLQIYHELNLSDNSIISTNKSNFKIPYSAIQSVNFNKRKKFGMGYIPHDGRICIETNKKREFIILGNQNGDEISESIKFKMM